MPPEFTPRSGLSLLELLVSLALMALIAAGLAGAFGLGTQLWTRTQALDIYNAEITRRIQLRNWIAQATPPTRLTPFNVGLVGDAKQVSFYTLAQTPFAPDAAIMQITVSQAAEELRMQITLLDDLGTSISTSDVLLASEIGDLQISYFSQGGSDWQSNWDQTDGLPDLLRITMAEGSKPAWPEFIVRLRL